MNILPLVLTFIMVFTLCSSLLREETRSTFNEEKQYLSYLKAERDLKNKIEKKHFISIFGPVAKTGTTPPKKKELKITAYKSPRENVPPLDISRLNIYLLFQDPKSPGYSIIYELAAKLIRNLYGHAPFFKEAQNDDLEYQILDTIIDYGKKHKNIASLKDLFLPQKDLKTIFYKLLKGTSYYTLEKKEGYPPLEDFLYSDEKTYSKPLFFSFASTPILTALFGPDLTKEILALEKTKWSKDHKHHTVTKNELNKLLIETDNPFKLHPTEALTHLSFSKLSFPNKALTQTEKNTKIRIKKAFILDAPTGKL